MSTDVDRAVVVEAPQPQLPAILLFLLLSSALFLCLVSYAMTVWKAKRERTDCALWMCSCVRQ
jgi:hypothetical protein